MPDLHLISHHLCPYVQRAVIVLGEKGVPHRRTYIDLADKPDWFHPVSPLGRVPVLLVGDVAVFESQVIAEYLDEVTPGSLHPSDPLEKARHRSWIEFGSETLNAIAAFYNAQDAQAFAEKQAALRAKFARVEPEIAGPLFSGAGFHLIDGVWGTIFRYLDVFETIGDFGLMDGLEKVQAWRDAVSRRASVAAAPPAGYPERLVGFLGNRPSHLGALVRGQNHT